MKSAFNQMNEEAVYLGLEGKCMDENKREEKRVFKGSRFAI